MPPNTMKHIHRYPGICNGQPVIKGTRVTPKTVLGSVAEGFDNLRVRTRRTSSHSKAV